MQGTGYFGQEVDSRPPFNLVDAMIGVIVSPSETMRQIDAARPWLWALVFVMGTSALSWVSQITPLLARPRPTLPYAIQPWADLLFDLLQNPLVIAFCCGVLAPAGLALGVFILWIVGCCLGGEAEYTGLLSTQAFVSTPIILQAPLLGMLYLTDPDGGLTLMALSGVFGLWSWWLNLASIRESFRVSTGHALLIWLAPGILLGVLLVSALYWAFAR